MKNNKIIAIAFIVHFLTFSCGFLDVDPTDKVSSEALFSSEKGMEAFLANLYYKMPIESFDFTPENGYHYNSGTPNNNGRFAWVLTDDCIGSQVQDICVMNDYACWTPAYQLNYAVNSFMASLNELKTITEDQKEMLLGQAWFVRGQLYFALARRYGGVPIIETVGDISDIEKLKIQRTTEVKTWDYVLKCFDEAEKRLGGVGNEYNTKADSYVALAYKSRAALHAASVGKYWKEAPLKGVAVDSAFVGGFSVADVNRYYKACLDASEKVISSGIYELYKPLPSSVEEAVSNIEHLFQQPQDALCESIFVRGFNKNGDTFGTNQDVWGNPAQTAGSWPHPGRFNPTLEYAENFETYGHSGESIRFETYEGDSYDYNGFNAERKYIQFDDPLDMFKDRDARLAASVILPNSTWKGTKIVIQGGIITVDGEIKMDVDGDIKAEYYDADGNVQYQFGSNDQKFFSGFSTNAGNNTRTGFGFRKYLDPSFESSGTVWNESITDWMDIRFAEILLNYAEAAVESGLGDMKLAETCLNRTRRRAAHMDTIKPTLENILRERRAELSLENARTWDLVRRREYHKIFDGHKRGSLTPVLDLRTGKYIFIREYVQKTDFQIFQDKLYYKSIPSTSVNCCIQNPQY